MEDGIALYEAFRSTGGRDVAAALAQFESQRREEVEKTQHSADVSLVWFEHVDRFWNMDPTRFAFGLMTRSKAITYDNLALRAPEFVKQADRVVARDVRALGFDAEKSFFVPDDAMSHFREAVARGAEAETAWTRRFDAYAKAEPELAAEFRRTLAGDLPEGWDRELPRFDPADAQATRQAGGKALNALAKLFPDREVVGINCTELVWGLGALHCMTQQQPRPGRS